MLRNRWVGTIVAGLAAWSSTMVGGAGYSQETRTAPGEAAAEAARAVDAAKQKVLRLRKLVRSVDDPALVTARAAKEKAEEKYREVIARFDNLAAQEPENSAKPKVTDPKAGDPGATTADSYILLAPQDDAKKAAEAEWRRAMQAKGYLSTREVRVTTDDGLLGLSVVPADELLREQLALGSHGLVVTAVAKGSPAQGAKIAENDILLEMGGKSLTTVEDLRGVARKVKNGSISLELLRAGERVKIEFKPIGPEIAKRQAELEKAHAEERARHAAEAHARREAPKFWIGVSVNEIDATLRSHLKINEGTGLVVNQVVEGSPAEKAGLKKNDVIVSIGDRLFKAPSDLITIVQDAKDQKPLTIKYLRAGKEKVIEVRPQERPKETAGAQGGNNPQAGIDGNANQLVQIYTKMFQGKPGERAGLFAGNPIGAGDAAGLGRPLVFVTANGQATPTDIKLEELAKKVEALTKAVEALKDRLPEPAKSK